MRTCRQPGCKISWPVVATAGRPKVWCDEHGTTAASSRRSRSVPRSPKPPCCPARGRCPQHKQSPGQRRHISYWDRNADTLTDFLSVFGHAQIVSDTGMPIYTWTTGDEFAS